MNENWKQDFLDWLFLHKESFVDDHLNFWADRYYRHTLEYIENDLSVNYDWSCDIEWCETELDRELSDDEKEYFIEYFTRQIVDNFYL